MPLRRLVVALCLFISAGATAAPIDFKVLFDSDDNQFTGCAVSGMNGVDYVFTTNVDTTAPAHVTGILGQRCAGTALGAATLLDSGGWPALWNETSGELSLETRIPLSYFEPRPGRRMRVGVVASSGSNSALLLLRSDGGPIVLPGVPLRRRAVSTPGRVFSPDGSAADWSGILPLAVGGGGSPALRIIEVYGVLAGENVFFRFVGQVSPHAPTAADDSYSTSPGTPITIATPGVLGNDTDPRGRPLAATLVDDVNHGALVLNSDGSFNYTDDGAAQRDHFTYRADNGEQQSNIARVDIGIGSRPNRAPVSGDDAYEVPRGGTLTVIPPGVLGNDSDPDLDPLQAVLVTGAGQGTVTLNPNGSFTYVHAGANTTPDSFTYHATDGIETSRETTVHINVRPNQAPVAVDDAYTVTEGGIVSQPAPGVLANDSDPDGTALTASVVTQPLHGSAIIGADGSFTYVHDGSETAADQFTYQISDGAATASAVVRITVLAANDAPVASNDSYSVAEDGLLNIAAPGVLANDSDVDSAVTSAVLSSSTVNGTLTLNTNGSFSYSPNPNFNGTDSFTYRAGDGLATSAPATVTITVTPVNDAPSFTAGPSVTVAEDSASYSAAWATAVVAGPANESAQTLTFTATNDNNALFSVQPSIAPNGTLSFTPAVNANGTATVTVTLADNGTPVLTTAPITFTITVTAVNDAPSFIAGPGVTVLEDGGAYNAAWATAVSAGPADEAGQLVAFAVTNDNNPLFAVQPSISSAGGLSFTPAANANGTATVTVIATDNGMPGASSAAQTFTITVTPVNDAPGFMSGGPVTGTEDTPYSAAWATGINAGPADEAGQTLAFNATNDNNALFAVQPAVTPGGVLSFTPAANANGTATVTIALQDNGGSANAGVDTSAPQMFMITVTAVNDTPTFAAGANVTVNEDSGAYSAPSATAISPGPADEAAQTVSFGVTNDNNALFAVQPAINSAGLLTFTPAPNANGTATVTVTATDNGVPPASSAAQTFTITITPVNDAPAFTSGGSVMGTEDTPYSAAWATGISAGPADEAGQTLTFNATNDNNALFAVQPAVSATGVLSFTPAPNTNGTATVTLTLSDNGGVANSGVDTSASQMFTITITAVNDAPSFTSGGNLTVLEDSAAFNAAWASAISAGPSDEAGQTVAFGVTNDNNAIFVVQPAINGSGTLTFTLAANANGTATVTVSATDNGVPPASSASQLFTITVTPVNDVPSFTVGPDVQASSVSGAITINPWITVLSAGPPNEAAQTLSFEITANSNPGLFTVAPAVSSTGALTFTPVSGVSGTSNITLRIKDNGGVTDGGVDSSATQSFNITLDAPPALTANTPADAAVVAWNTNLQMTFSEPVNVAGNWFQIVCASGTRNVADTVVTGGPTTFDINPNADFAPGDACTVTLFAAAITDQDLIDPPDTPTGNASFSFTVDMQPTVASITPANGATGVVTNADVVIQFSEPVTVAAASFTINCVSGARTFALSGSGASYTLNPDVDFAPGENCTVTVPAAQVTDADAIDPPDNMAADFVATFATDAAPSVAATTPANGTTSLAAADLSITFSEPVDVTGNWFQISCTLSGVRNVADTAVTGGPTVFTVNPNVDFMPGDSCTMTIFAAQVDDQDPNDPPANMAADYVFSYTVDAPPAVTSTTPANGATDVAANTDVTINFSESVNITGTSFNINCTVSGLHAYATAAAPAASFVLNPTVDFASGDSCTVTVAAAQVTDADAFDPPDNMVADYVFTFAVDAAPFVSVTSPVNGATDVEGDTTIGITFSEPVNAPGTAFTISCTSSGAHTFGAAGGPTAYTLTPVGNFTSGEVCTVTVLAAQVTDVDANDPPDNMLVDHVFSFTIDLAPTVTSTNPSDTTTGVTTNADIAINFSEVVNLTGSAVTVNCATSGAHTVVLSASPSASFTANPDADFAAGEVCTVVVLAAQVTDADANDPPDNMPADHVFTFTTDEAPSVSATTPANAGIGAPDADVTVTFNEAVDVTGSWYGISCTTSGAHTAVVSGGPTTFTINPDVNFTGGETCTVSIFAAQVTDQDGNDPPDNMVADHVFTFTIDGAPVVIATNPANGAVDRAANTTIQITYDEAVTDAGTAYSIECPAPGNLQAFVLAGNGTAVHTLTPSLALPAGVTCTVTILAAQISDVDANDPPDNMASNHVFSFSTDAAPSVTATTPVNGATGVTTTANVSLTFSESVSLTASAVTLSCVTSGAHTVVVSASPNSSFTVNPDTDFTQGEVCTVTVVANQVTDTDANDPPDNMTANHVFSFTVDEQPSVTATTPTNAATNLATNTTIQITFSEAVTAPDAAFTIECPVASAQAFTGSGSGTNVVTLTPAASLPAGVTCTVTVFAASIADVDANDPPDNMASDYVFTFTTDAAPAVTTTTPTNGATDIAQTANITVNFSENVDVTTSTFTIKCPSAGAALPFAFVGASTNTNTVTLNPNSDLPDGEQCEVTVLANQVSDTDLADPPDNLGADYVFTFGVEPDAIDDTHPNTHVGNIASDSAVISYSASANDSSVNAFTITAFDATTVNGGTIVMTTSGAGMGQFTYNPPPGFEGTDTFTYTISNAHGTDTATVSIPVSGMVWFINNAAGAGDGRLATPFNSLTAFDSVNGNADAGNARNPQAGDNIFIYESGAAYVGPVVLENNQKLIGQDSATSLSGLTGLMPATSQSAFPGVNSANGVFVEITSPGIGVTLASNNHVRGLRFGANTSRAIGGTNFGTLTVRDSLINNPSGGGIVLNTGTMDVVLASLTTTGGLGGLWTQTVGGTFSAPAGTISNPTSAGILFSSSNPTITFGGTVSVTNGLWAISGTNLTGGSLSVGTVNVSGAGTPGADAITIDGTGTAFDLSVSSVNINTNSIRHGIRLGDLGAGSDVTITSGTITSQGSGRRVFDLSGIVNCTCNLAGVTLNGNSSDGISLASTHLGTYQFGDFDVNTPNGGIGVQVLGDANAANVDSSVTFKSIDIAGCSQAGINVHSHSGSFAVNGTGVANSGGTISNCTQRGARFGLSTSVNTGAKNITLTDMNFTGNGTVNISPAGTCGDLINGTNTNCAAGIDLQQAQTVTLTRVAITNGAQNGLNGNNVTSMTLNNVDVTNAGDEANENGVNLHNLFGTSTWTQLDATENSGSQMEIQNSSSTPLNLTINGGTFSNAVWPGSTTSSHGVLFSGTNNANMTLSLQNANIARNFGPAFQTDTATGADITVTINGGTMIDNGQHFVFAGTGSGDVTYTVTNISQMYVDPAHSGVTPISIARGDGASGNYTGVIQGNIIGNAGIANSGACSGGCNIISVRNNGSSGGFNRVTIGGTGAGQGNTLQRSGGGGINVTSGLNVSNDSGTMQVKIIGNTITGSDNLTATGLPLAIVNGTAGGDTSTTCADVLNNTIQNTGGTGSWNLSAVLRLRHPVNNTIFRLPGYTGALTDTAAVVTYLQGRNTIPGGSSAAVQYGGAAGGGYSNTAPAGSQCF